MTLPVKPLSFARSHIGTVRASNEDRVLNFTDRGLWAVADGMGGHMMGDVAAQMVVTKLAEAATSFDVLSLEILNNALAEANRRIRALSGGGQQAGSTVAGLFISNGNALTFWAGDSRVYRQRAGELTQLTRDHRVVQDLVDAGIIDAGQARGHPRSTVITRAIGAEADFQLANRVDSVLPGDAYLICSDGLSDLVDDVAIGKALTAPSEQEANQLVYAALAAGGTDNISFVIIGLGARSDIPSETQF